MEDERRTADEHAEEPMREVFRYCRKLPWSSVLRSSSFDSMRAWASTMRGSGAAPGAGVNVPVAGAVTG